MAAASGAPFGSWVRNPAAWCFGLLAAGLIARIPARPVLLLSLIVMLAGLLGTLFGPSVAGVHRWVRFGPVRLNIAELLLPPAIVALAFFAGKTHWIFTLAGVTAAVLIAQPDASQATAFGVAFAVVLLHRPLPAGLGSTIAFGIMAIAGAWLRPDRLPSVAEVEGIVSLAHSAFPVVLAITALAAAIFSPLLLASSNRHTTRTASLALLTYSLLSAAAPMFGAFPVPLVGISVSPIVGLWLGSGLLASVAREELARSSSQTGGK